MRREDLRDLSQRLDALEIYLYPHFEDENSIDQT